MAVSNAQNLVDVTADPSITVPGQSFTFADVATLGKDLSNLAESGGEGNIYAAAVRGLVPLLGGIDDEDKVKSVQGFQTIIPAIGFIRKFVDTFGFNNANNNLLKTLTQQVMNAQQDARTDLVVSEFSKMSGKSVDEFTDLERGQIEQFSRLINNNFTDFTPADIRNATNTFFNRPDIQDVLAQPSVNTLADTQLTDVVRPGDDVRITRVGDASINPRTGLPFGEESARNLFIASTNQLESPKAQILEQAGIETSDSTGFNRQAAMNVLRNVEPGAATGGGISPVFQEALQGLFEKADEGSALRKAIGVIFGSNPELHFLNKDN